MVCTRTSSKSREQETDAECNQVMFLGETRTWKDYEWPTQPWFTTYDAKRFQSTQLSLPSQKSMLEAQPHKFSPVGHYGCPTHCDQLVKKQEYFIANMRSQKENTERDFNLLFQHMIFRQPWTEL